MYILKRNSYFLSIQMYYGISLAIVIIVIVFIMWFGGPSNDPLTTIKFTPKSFIHGLDRTFRGLWGGIKGARKATESFNISSGAMLCPRGIHLEGFGTRNHIGSEYYGSEYYGTDNINNNFSFSNSNRPILPETGDFFQSDIIGGSESDQISALAFDTDTSNRIRSRHMGTAEVVREALTDNVLLLGGDREGSQKLQSNPFVKKPINNPYEVMSYGIEGRAF